ncbi:GumC family protein [Botrimarina sp.]|uniref:GumC family protein n=1 Tax=Botrimarina sp. TaxID=2795802 RepID=UPI0032EC0D14
MPSSRTSSSPRDVAEVVFRHKWKVLLIPTVVIGAGLAVALFMPRTYRSEAKLALRVGRQSVSIDPVAQTGQQTISLQQMGRESEVKTAIDLLRSRGVIAKVVDRLGPEYVLRGGPDSERAPLSPAGRVLQNTLGAPLESVIGAVKSIDPISEREEAIIEVEDNLDVDAERDSTLILVTYSTKSPLGAQRVLDTLIDVYRSEHLRVHRNEGSLGFFQEQEAQFREQLDEAMRSLRDSKNKMGVASIETRRENLENQLQSVELAFYQAEAERDALAAELVDLGLKLGELPERLVASKRSIPNEGADLLRDQLYALQVRQADLKARYSDTHPLVVAVTRQVDEATKVVDGQSTVRQETTDDINPIHRELSLLLKQKQSQFASLDARLAALAKQADAVRSDLERVNTQQVEIARLERDEAILSRKFHRYTDNLEQARIDEQLQAKSISSVNVAQSPTLAEKPVSPSKAIVGLGAIALAVGLTVATVLGLEQLNDRVRSEDALEQASGVPLLASIPESKSYKRVLTS